jgi:hypothetical protein
MKRHRRNGEQPFLATALIINLGTLAVDQSLDMQEVSLVIDDLSEVGKLIIWNGRDAASAPSVAELHDAVLQRVR